MKHRQIQLHNTITCMCYSRIQNQKCTHELPDIDTCIIQNSITSNRVLRYTYRGPPRCCTCNGILLDNTSASDYNPGGQTKGNTYKIILTRILLLINDCSFLNFLMLKLKYKTASNETHFLPDDAIAFAFRVLNY